MKHTNVAKLYTAIVDLSNGVIPEDFPMPTQPEFRFKQSERTAAAEPAFQLSEDPVSVSSIATITPGVTINGQCLCTCSQSQHKSFHSFASSSDNDYAGRLQTSSGSDQVDGNSGSTTSRGQHHQPQPAVYYNPQQQSSYARAVAAQQAQQQTYYQQQQQPTYYQQQQQPTSSALNTETGIANGFERFFSGLPPIR
uniref:Uncharacterized protein n=1 Tax=Ditylenchus dipsaci TaxID=166011 RepID=A0A915EFH6_9BILA